MEYYVGGGSEGGSSGSRWRLMKQIGSGSFGDIYLGVNCVSGEPVAVKLEPVTARHPQLEAEFKLYQLLNKTGTVGSPGVAKVMHFAKELRHNVLVMELLGPSLEELFNFCSRRFSVKTVLMLADQMLSRLEYLHSQGWVHQDVKPDNFTMGQGAAMQTVYLIDFGLCKRYLDFKGRHIPYREDRHLTGTARYASVNAHLGLEQSRRDDLESLGYCLAYFLSSQLPWQGLKANNKRQKYERISECKMQTSVESLCQGFPCSELAMLINYCRSLHFDEAPDYAYLRQLLRIAMRQLGYQFDWAFDWIVLRNQICSQPPQQPVMQQQ
ncbi:hypothetical protein BOX15_Mlig006686g5 [Macrostomum lignano]|uniref:Protein kinase domain-containing protein n=2 Tax=Macrostomum lignano TaxID=282301 RepID=A0A267H3L6_9PLAT|nr:hypothetical protein BOX15_Mlig006686g1 [Macrostomum lignano]PAA85083.1 hypothetical protein BOX15_Mlig017133g1 [Macrostomum lignano]PAA92878.1 hypothetical protein BOX15_Mlig006686g5 [Macrostomum lignano]